MNNQDTSFSLTKGERDGLPYFAIVRHAFQQFGRRANLQWLLKIEIDIEYPTEIGLVPNMEAEELNNLEDFFQNKLRSVADILFVARITWNGIRFLYFYVSEPKPIAEQLDLLIQTGQYPKEFEYRIERDPRWEKMAEIIPNINDL